MVQIPTWKRILIIGVVLLSILYSLPNLLPKEKLEQLGTLPSIVPHKTVNLGLDLQGGSHILLQVDLASVIKQRSDDVISSLRPSLRDKKIGYKRLAVIPGGGIRVTLKDAADGAEIAKAVRALDNTLTVTITDTTVEGTFSEAAIKQVKDQVLSQSIEIVRRRIDETGTNEPVIQRQGDDRIVVQLPGLGDPTRVKELLGKTAKLSFHLVNMDVASSAIKTTGGDMILPMQERPGETLAVQRQAMLTGDMLTNAAFAQDQNGGSAVSFRFNAIGTKKFCELSRENVNRLFAIVLDNVIISAPVIREPICGGSGQISGSFSVKEANDLAILLRAGALPAPLNIIEERTVGPSLGADSIEAGKKAALLGLVLVFVLMIGSYSLFGVFSCIGMLVNLTITFAALSILQATLTMPGIAGLVLTVCMSVDANVLIYERIREELREGKSAISAIDHGFKMAFATITDSNLTHIFAAIILFSLGSGAIKGFAVTTIIGTAASFFTSISVVRLMIIMWLGRRKNAALPV
ncbi:MAG: protein translocase subunit SecD [Micavibrio aeruginosavorus]|uniref:Protein translocase subunit SecD n=1 Tax=Micavibrio aeruginosavorus TaxID=349221 RepID=A0A2W5MS46_9BACT|nr:MAG: protein translocase subunit SecD [Micavibrio aeruginosavorus]